MGANSEAAIPKKNRPKYDEIVALISRVCKEHLSDEYAYLGRRLVAQLARKRPSPIERGKPEIWACAAIYALGKINFLFDKSQTPHMRADELCKVFGVSMASGSAKARVILDILDTFQLDPNWTLPSRMDRNPLIWMLQVNGFIVDIRHMPREAQVVAYEQGLIPYIPADREENHSSDSTDS